MTAKHWVAAALVLFVAAGVGTFLAREFAPPRVTAASPVNVTEPVTTPSDLPDQPVSRPSSDQGIETPSSTAVQETTPAPSVPEPRRWVLATYFHNTVRCPTCLSIERNSREALQAAFASDFASGKLVWRTVNMEDKGNDHYVTDYQLPYPSLVITEMSGEREVRFELLGETWNLIHGKPETFAAYITSGVEAWLREVR